MTKNERRVVEIAGQAARLGDAARAGRMVASLLRSTKDQNGVVIAASAAGIQVSA